MADFFFLFATTVLAYLGCFLLCGELRCASLSLSLSARASLSSCQSRTHPQAHRWWYWTATLARYLQLRFQKNVTRHNYICGCLPNSFFFSVSGPCTI
ncbi:hypothetical protein BC826DRAFT_1052517, partial [Russula brevipes]